MELNKCNVTFDPTGHTYLIDGVIPVVGITGVLERQLFPGRYDDVPAAKLEAARKRGSDVHEAVALYDRSGLVSDEALNEIKGYLAECKSHEWMTIENEYTVTDGKDYASNIDLVMEDVDGRIVLADIKTTYELDRAYVKWQLSIYAYLFELVNPHLHVHALYGLWLRGEQHEAVEVERVPSEEITRLLECDRMGYTYIPMGADIVKHTTSEDVPAVMEPTVIDKYIAMTEQMAKLQEGIDAIKEAALEAMKAYGVKSWKGERMSLTYVAPKVSKRLDSKRLKEEKPDIYEAYTTETQAKESILIKIKS